MEGIKKTAHAHKKKFVGSKSSSAATVLVLFQKHRITKHSQYMSTNKCEYVTIVSKYRIN